MLPLKYELLKDFSPSELESIASMKRTIANLREGEKTTLWCSAGLDKLGINTIKIQEDMEFHFQGSVVTVKHKEEVNV